MSLNYLGPHIRGLFSLNICIVSICDWESLDGEGRVYALIYAI